MTTSLVDAKADTTTKDDDVYEVEEITTKQIGMDGSNLLSRLLVLWVSPIMFIGLRRRLEPDDLKDYLPRALDCVETGKFLEHNWTSFLPTVYKLLKYDVWSAVPAFLLLTASGVSIPFLIRGYLSKLTNPEGDGNNIWMFVGLMILLGTIQAFSINYGFLIGSIFSVRVRAALTHMIFRKAIRLRSSATSGSVEVLNLMSSDVERIFHASFVFHSMWWSILQVCLVLILICTQVGVAGLGSIAVILVVSPLNVLIGKCLARRKHAMLARTDARVSLSGEVVLGIQTVKMQSWEDKMKERIQTLRKLEMEQGGAVLRLMAVNAWQTFALPPVMAACCFAILATTGDGLSVAIIYTVLSFLSALDVPLNFIPRATSSFAQAAVSIKRIEAFMRMEDFDASRQPLQQEDGGEEDCSKVLIRLRDVSLYHTTNKEEEASPAATTRVNVLSKLTFDIMRGELLVVVGSVGAGKSSLLAGLLGEMGVSQGSIAFRYPDATMAYVPQEPWILNTTMKNNVLFGREENPDLYQRVLAAMGMLTDVKMLPNGDATEIGSRGINLSGGQKARVGMARAVYHALAEDDKEKEEILVVCDDPFSALDPNLANLVWRDAVEGLLAQHTRIVCLNSNLALAKNADRIIVLEQGEVAAIASPMEILEDARFAWLFDNRKAEEAPQEQEHNEPDPALAAAISGNMVFEDIDAQDEAPVSAASSPRVAPQTTLVEPVVQVDTSGQLYKAEERASGAVSLKTFKSWFRAGALFDCGGYVATALIIILLYGATQGFKVFADLFLGMWAYSETKDGEGANLAYGLGIYFGALAAMLFFALSRTITFVTVCRNASVRLHDDFVDHLLRAPVNLFFDITPTGRILNRMSNDLDHIDARLPEVALNLLHNVFQILGAVSMAIYANPYILLLLLPVTLAFSLIATILSRTQRELKRLDAMSRSPLFSHFGETLQGATSIRAFKTSQAFIQQNAALTNTNATYYLLFWVTARWFALRVDMLAVFVQFCILALNIASSANNQNPAVIGLAVTYSLILTTTIQAATRNFVETSNAMVACERICDFIENVPLERKDGRDDFQITRGTVEFRNVSTRYRPNLELCVKNVSFTVEGGQKLGICGRSGASKSTLGNLLFGMLQCEGEGDIYFDGVGSKQLSLHCLRSQLSVIPQQPVIFSGTIRFALDPCEEAGSDSVLWDVLRQVQLEQFVMALPGKLDGRVEENASQFSVGERQLLCIARALLRRSKIVLLDESTSSIDSQSDQIVQQSIKTGFQGSTIFIIAHRLHTIIDCDLIAVMSQGELKEFAPPATLLAREEGMFKAMWELEDE